MKHHHHKFIPETQNSRRRFNPLFIATLVLAIFCLFMASIYISKHRPPTVTVAPITHTVVIPAPTYPSMTATPASPIKKIHKFVRKLVTRYESGQVQTQANLEAPKQEVDLAEHQVPMAEVKEHIEEALDKLIADESNPAACDAQCQARCVLLVCWAEGEGQ